jgi:hypothetical protein
LLFFWSGWLPFSEGEIEKSTTITLLGVNLCFMSRSICFMKLSMLTIGVNMFNVFIAFWWIVPFISMKWSYVYLLISCHLKFILSDTSIAIHACFPCLFDWKVFSIPFTLSPCLCFPVRCFTQNNPTHYFITIHCGLETIKIQHSFLKCVQYLLSFLLFCFFPHAHWHIYTSGGFFFHIFSLSSLSSSSSCWISLSIFSRIVIMHSFSFCLLWRIVLLGAEI